MEKEKEEAGDSDYEINCRPFITIDRKFPVSNRRLFAKEIQRNTMALNVPNKKLIRNKQETNKKNPRK